MILFIGFHSTFSWLLMCKKYIFYVFHYPTRSSHIYEEQDTLQKRKKNLINKLMAKGDLQR